MPDSSTFAAVDIGGTKVATGIVDEAGNILTKARVPMIANRDAETAVSAVFEALDQILSKSDTAPSAIGIISPGPLDPNTGVILNPPNLPCWREFPLGARVSARYGLPTFVENDANAAGLAEALWGVGAGYKAVFYVTLGTGIGTALVLDGDIYNGRTGAALEAGHLSINFNGPRCGCGKPGCIEAYASGTAIAARARAKAAEVPSTRMVEFAGGDTAAITSHEVVKAWRNGDAAATEVLVDTARYLGIWLGGMVDVLEPEVVVIGGGLAELAMEWIDEIRATATKWAINQRCGEIPVLHARYSADAGIAGAAALCFAARTSRP